MRPFFLKLWILALLVSLLTNCLSDHSKISVKKSQNVGLHKLEYNNPGLIVDLDAGFKTIPMPMDFDGDGDYDLLISESGAYAEAGIFYFENISGNTEMPVFRRGMKVSFERRRLGGDDGNSFEVSEVEEHIHVITPDRVNEKLLIYKDIPQNVFWDENELLLPSGGYNYLHFFKTQWKMVDFDGDGIKDLVCAASPTGSPDLRGTGSTERKKAYTLYPKHRQLIYLRNKADNNNPVYEDPIEILKENGEPLGNELSIKPMFADYDNDGDLDFIGIGENENDENFDVEWKRNFFIYYENSGTKYKYKFTEGKVITDGKLPIQMVSRANIHLTSIDWDKDGNIDMIGGDEDGKVSFIKNTGLIVNGVPQFLPPRFFQQEAKYVDLGALTAPRVFDWDGDGLDDILAGNGVGNIGFIKNLGGDIPRWDAPKLLEVNGVPLRLIPNESLPNTGVPYWGYTTIDVGLWDEDELPDIIVNGHNGNVVYLKNTGSLKKPKLSPPEPIEVEWKGNPQKPAWIPGTSSGNELLAPWRTSPLIMDYNKDGLNDLVILDYEGYLAVYPRSKKDGKLILGHPQRNFVYPSGEPILLNQRTGSSSGRLKITFADWDGDGLEDLIVSSKPAVDWMKNTGIKDGKMVLQYMGRVLSQTLMGHTDGPVVADWNKDGIPDLLVGTETGVFYYWERSSFDVTTTMTTSGKQTPANYPYFKR